MNNSPKESEDILSEVQLRNIESIIKAYTEERLDNRVAHEMRHIRRLARALGITSLVTLFSAAAYVVLALPDQVADIVIAGRTTREYEKDLFVRIGKASAYLEGTEEEIRNLKGYVKDADFAINLLRNTRVEEVAETLKKIEGLLGDYPIADAAIKSVLDWRPRIESLNDELAMITDKDKKEWQPWRDHVSDDLKLIAATEKRVDDLENQTGTLTPRIETLSVKLAMITDKDKKEWQPWRDQVSDDLKLIAATEKRVGDLENQTGTLTPRIETLSVKLAMITDKDKKEWQPWREEVANNLKPLRDWATRIDNLETHIADWPRDRNSLVASVAEYLAANHKDTLIGADGLNGKPGKTGPPPTSEQIRLALSNSTIPMLSVHTLAFFDASGKPVCQLEGSIEAGNNSLGIFETTDVLRIIHDDPYDESDGEIEFRLSKERGYAMLIYDRLREHSDTNETYRRSRVLLDTRGKNSYLQLMSVIGEEFVARSHIGKLP